MGATITDTEKLSSSKHKTIKQWSKYATKNTKAGGDEVIMTRTMEKVGSKLAKKSSQLQADYDDGQPKTDPPNDDSSTNLPPITPSMIPTFDIPPIPPMLPTDQKPTLPPQQTLPPPVQIPIKDQSTKPQIVPTSSNLHQQSVHIQPQYFQSMAPNQYIHSAPNHITTVPVQSIPVQSVPVQSVPVQYQPQYIQTMVQQPHQYIHQQSVPVTYSQYVAPPQTQLQPQVTQQSYQPRVQSNVTAANHRYHPYQRK